MCSPRNVLLGWGTYMRTFIRRRGSVLQASSAQPAPSHDILLWPHSSVLRQQGTFCSLLHRYGGRVPNTLVDGGENATSWVSVINIVRLPFLKGARSIALLEGITGWR